MSQANSIDFYRRRERQARDLAEAARSAEIRAIHLHMAETYAALIDRSRADPGHRRTLSIA